MPNPLTRRQFLATSTATAIALSTPRKLAFAAAAPRAQVLCKSQPRPDRLSGSFPDAVELATKHGFEGVAPDLGYFASLNDDALHRLLDDLKTRKLKLGAADLPVEFHRDAATFNTELKKLPDAAAVLQKAGIWRINTYILPCSNDLTYLQNFRQHRPSTAVRAHPRRSQPETRARVCLPAHAVAQREASLHSYDERNEGTYRRHRRKQSRHSTR